MNETNKPFLATSRAESLRRLTKVLWILWTAGLATTILLFVTSNGTFGIVVALLTVMLLFAVIVASMMLKASRRIDDAKQTNTDQ